MRVRIIHQGKSYWRVPGSNIAYAPGLKAWLSCTYMTWKVIAHYWMNRKRKGSV